MFYEFRNSEFRIQNSEFGIRNCEVVRKWKVSQLGHRRLQLLHANDTVVMLTILSRNSTTKSVVWQLLACTV